MSDLNKIHRGEVFYINSRSDTVGSEQRGGRPAVIVSNNISNEHSPCVEICFMTLKEKHQLPTHVFVDRGKCINSIILCEQVTTVAKERVGEYLCTLPDDIMDDVDKAIVVSLGLDYIINQEVKNVSSTPAYEVISEPQLKELDKLRAEVNALETQNKELIVARDNAMKKAEGAESAKQEAKLYKKMYDSLLDKVLDK